MVGILFIATVKKWHNFISPTILATTLPVCTGSYSVDEVCNPNYKNIFSMIQF